MGSESRVEEYLDEKVAEMKRKTWQSDYNSIETGKYVNNRLVEFEAVELFEHKLSVALPKDMKPMPQEMARFKYPSEERPQVIYTNEDGTVNFMFNHFTEMKLEAKYAMKAANQFKGIIQKVQPANIFYEMQEEELDSGTLGWFDFQSYALDSRLYNIMFITPLDGAALHGMFNCGSKDGAEWKPVVKLVMKSLVDLTVK